MEKEIKLKLKQMQKVIELKKKVDEAKRELSFYLEGLSDGLEVDKEKFVFDLDNLKYMKK